jgi:L-ribulose-5-phosphate 3-epimerase
MTHFKLGIIAESMGLPIRQAISQASALGVEGLQFDAVGELAPMRIGETGRREFRNQLKSYNLELSALACPLRRGLDSQDDLDRRLDQIQQAMQLAYDLGPKKIIVPLPKLPTDATSVSATTLRDALTVLGRCGDRVGCLVSLEIGLDSAEVVKAYLESFEVGTLTINYDPANMLMNGHDPLASAAKLAGHITHTHARDARRSSINAGPKEVPVGAGDIEWLAYLATLEAIEYRGYLTIEREPHPHALADLTASVTFLRRFVPRPQA